MFQTGNLKFPDRPGPSRQHLRRATSSNMMMMKLQKATQNLTKDFWSMRGDSIYRHREEPKWELYTPENEALPNPLKYVAVMRRTPSTIDNVSEIVIQDILPEAKDVNLFEDWTGTARFQILRTRFEGHVWVSGRPTKIQTITRPDSICPEPGCSCPRTAAKRNCRLGCRKCQTAGSTPQRKSTRDRSMTSKDDLKVTADARLKDLVLLCFS